MLIKHIKLQDKHADNVVNSARDFVVILKDDIKYTNLADVDPAAPVAIMAPFDASENLYLA
jgi:hypothetical protein